MKARLSIRQFELELGGGTGRILVAEASGSENVRKALGAVGRAIAGQPIDWLSEGRLPSVTTHEPAPRARRTDPSTSHAAANRAAAFVGDHETRIVAAIKAAGERGACSKEIARSTGLTHVQCDRRLSGMGERELIERKYENGGLVRREGCACWVAI